MSNEKPTESVETVQLDPVFCFPTIAYVSKFPKFLDAAKTVASEAIAERKKEIKKLNEIYPLVMTGNLNYDPRMLDMANCIAQSSWKILDDQGYAMQNLSTYFTEFWCQEHHKHSGMDQHVHGHGSQIVGFYFIDVPKGSSRVLFHDPKVGKNQISLPQKDRNQMSPASDMINFEPEPGMCIFANAWLPHSFTRHEGSKPMRFIHFNVSVRENTVAASCTAPAEII
ncbi:Conserved hypothetical protein CHP02466 [uncultured Caudovirales phage]|uniref:Uncharacterized protein n=1 Tax=uncultured Caudovirales phage TaxID=2100421 RepID=A0A6J5L1Q8_9CAUD|nr:Conserved hypothetical protein CHP02466 [uncultured Caudovirales phage]